MLVEYEAGVTEWDLSETTSEVAHEFFDSMLDGLGAYDSDLYEHAHAKNVIPSAFAQFAQDRFNGVESKEIEALSECYE